MLVEREEVLGAARQALTAADDNDGGLVIISGLPGAGRSAVLGAVIEMAEADCGNGLTLRADATLAERDFPYGVMQQIVRPLVTTASDAELRRWFAGTAEAIRPMFLDEEIGSAPWSPGIVLPALHTLMTNLAAERPLLLAIDDLQWADQPSLRCLACLARRSTGSRVLTVATVADGYAMTESDLVADIRRAADRTLHTEPLSVAGVRKVAEAEFGAACEPDFAHACHEATAGNPAALLTVLRGLRATGAQPVDAATVAVEAPVLLRERHLFYLSAQPESVRTAARALMVLGDHAVPELVAVVADLDPLAYKSALNALDRVGLLAATEPPRLIDSSLQVALDAAMTVAERERLHRKAAMALHDAGHSAEQVADQLLWIASGHQRWETDVLRSAASAALHRGEGKQAVRYVRRALLAGPVVGPERASLLVDLAAAERGLDPVAAVSHISQALPDLSSVSEQASAILTVPFALAERSSSVGAVLRAHVTSPDLRFSGAYHDLTLRLEARGRALDDHDPYRLADAVTRLRGFGDARPLDTGGGRELMAVLAHAAAVSASMPAKDVAALGAAVLDREPPAPTHVHTSMLKLVSAMTAADAAASAGHWLDRVWETARSQEAPGVRAVVSAERSAVACATGAITRARSLALGVLDGADPAWPQATVVATSTLTHIALYTQDAALAKRVLGSDHDATEPKVVLAHVMLRGLLDALRGDLVAALDKMIDCGDRAARYGWTSPAVLPWRIWAAALSQRLGDIGSALTLAEQEHEAALAWGAPHIVGRSMLLRGMLTGGPAGITALRDAVDVLRGSGDVIELARAMATLGRRLTGLGDVSAIEVNAQADRLVRECGVSWVDDAEAELNGPVTRLTTAARTELTTSELNVVALVLRGWTNQRIADSLGITRRAVEKSLTGVYRKLGVGGRSALAGQWPSIAPAGVDDLDIEL